jgi:hypothetical protein
MRENLFAGAAQEMHVHFDLVSADGAVRIVGGPRFNIPSRGVVDVEIHPRWHNARGCDTRVRASGVCQFAYGLLGLDAAQHRKIEAGRQLDNRGDRAICKGEWAFSRAIGRAGSEILEVNSSSMRWGKALALRCFGKGR